MSAYYGTSIFNRPIPLGADFPTTQVTVASAIYCGLSGAVGGAIVGALLGLIWKNPGKGAAWGAGIGAVGYGTVCALAASAVGQAAQSIKTSSTGHPCEPYPSCVSSLP
jgi:hypothetical protein